MADRLCQIPPGVLYLVIFSASDLSPVCTKFPSLLSWVALAPGYGCLSSWTGFGSLTPGSPPGLKNSLVTHLKPFPSLSLTTCVPRVSVSAGKTPPPFQTPRLKTSVTSPLPFNTQLAVHFKFTSFFFEMSMVSIPSSPIPPLPPLTRPRLVYPASWLSYGTPSSPPLPTYSWQKSFPKCYKASMLKNLKWPFTTSTWTKLLCAAFPAHPNSTSHCVQFPPGSLGPHYQVSALPYELLSLFLLLWLLFCSPNWTTFSSYYSNGTAHSLRPNKSYILHGIYLHYFSWVNFLYTPMRTQALEAELQLLWILVSQL